MKASYAMQAAFCRTIGHPKRLQLLALLSGGEANVTQLAKAMEVRAASVSQELAPLRMAGIVQQRRDGKHVFYRLSNPKILRICDLMAQAMYEALAARIGMPPRLLRYTPPGGSLARER